MPAQKIFGVVAVIGIFCASTQLSVAQDTSGQGLDRPTGEVVDSTPLGFSGDSDSQFDDLPFVSVPDRPPVRVNNNLGLTRTADARPVATSQTISVSTPRTIRRVTNRQILNVWYSGAYR